MELYKSAAKLMQGAESGESYKNNLYSIKNKKNIKSLHYLCTNSSKKKKIIDELLMKVGVPNITWLERVILYEFLWGRRKDLLKLSRDAVVGTILKHRQAILKHHLHVEKQTGGDMEIPRYIRFDCENFTKPMIEELLKNNSFIQITTPGSYTKFLNQVKLLKENEYMFDYHIPNLLVFSQHAKLQKFPQNHFIRQDKASCLVVPLLAPLPGSTILDMCAAPGYKTQHAASFISKLGRIYSVDINKERFSTLRKTVKQFHLEDCCIPLCSDALKINENTCPNVEYIILDAPCSGTGMSNVLIKHTASEERLKKLSNIQVMLLKHALKTFPYVRRIVYSTCSVTEEENEKVISECLQVANENGFRLVPISSAYRGSFHPGKGNYSWRLNVLRTFPDLDLTNGFFLALFERSEPPERPDWTDIRSTGNVLTGIKIKQNFSEETENTSEKSCEEQETNNKKNKKRKQKKIESIKNKIKESKIQETNNFLSNNQFIGGIIKNNSNYVNATKKFVKKYKMKQSAEQKDKQCLKKKLLRKKINT